jgi:cholesterol oxidase
MLAGPQGVRSAVASQIATDVVAPKVTRIKSGLYMPNLLAKLGVDSLTAYVDTHANWFEKLYDESLRVLPGEAEERCHSRVCRRITFMYAPLYEHDQLNRQTHDTLHETFGIANTAAFEHLALLVREGHLVDAGGNDAYMPHLDRLAIPIHFIHGAENACFLPRSTELTVERLSRANDPRLYSRDVIPRYGHIDCIMGANAVRDVFPRIARHLDDTD